MQMNKRGLLHLIDDAGDSRTLNVLGREDFFDRLVPSTKRAK
jgi:hypothetical protein